MPITMLVVLVLVLGSFYLIRWMIVDRRSYVCTIDGRVYDDCSYFYSYFYFFSFFRRPSSPENKILQLVLFRLLQAVRDDAAKLVHNTPRTKLFDDKVRQTLVTLRAVQRQAWCSTRRG